jgi:hypothetical protein
MTIYDQMEMWAQKIKNEVRAAIERGDDIPGEVRNIIIKALADYHMEERHFEQMAGAVLQGAVEGALEGSRELVEVMKKTIKGLDEAMPSLIKSSKFININQ